MAFYEHRFGVKAFFTITFGVSLGCEVPKSELLDELNEPTLSCESSPLRRDDADTVEARASAIAKAAAHIKKFRHIVQPVNFVIFHKSDGTGKVAFERLVKQVDQLNRAFSGSESTNNMPDTKIRFRLAGVRYVENDRFYDFCGSKLVMTEYRKKYGLGPATHLNVYVCRSTSYGLAWLPYQDWTSTDDMYEGHYALGTIVDHTLVAGGGHQWWSDGDILTHEVGHHYGLMHPYEGGFSCKINERYTDQIDDTPLLKNNIEGGCKAKPDNSCGGGSGISNYMVVTSDDCRTEFTPGQVRFMRATIAHWKPTLLAQRPPACVSAIDATDGSPDLQPCVGNVLTAKSGERWCRTDEDDPTVWGYACCSTDAEWSNDPCRTGTWSGEFAHVPSPK